MGTDAKCQFCRTGHQSISHTCFLMPSAPDLITSHQRKDLKQAPPNLLHHISTLILTTLHILLMGLKTSFDVLTFGLRIAFKSLSLAVQDVYCSAWSSQTSLYKTQQLNMPSTNKASVASKLRLSASRLDYSTHKTYIPAVTSDPYADEEPDLEVHCEAAMKMSKLRWRRCGASFLLLYVVLSAACLVLFRVPEHYVYVNPDALSVSGSAAERLEEMLMVRSQVLIYNRVPKCASFSLIILFTLYHRLYPQQAQMYRSTLNNSNIFRYMTHKAQRDYVVKFIEQTDKPFAYEQHVRFIDFAEHHTSPQPLYFNIVREPLDRMQSEWKFHNKANTEKKGFSWPTNTSFVPRMHGIFGRNFEYFCGQDAFCSENSERALQQAKQNVRKHYLLVGVTERLQDSVEVLEFFVPQYYSGIWNVYVKNNIHLNVLARKGGFTPEILQYLERDLRYDLAFYEWTRRRFSLLFDAMKDCKKKGYDDIFGVIYNRDDQMLYRLLPYLPVDLHGLPRPELPIVKSD